MITVLDPTNEEITGLDPSISRGWMPPLKSLRDIRIGLLGNAKEQSVELLEYVLEGLEMRDDVGVVSVSRHAKRDTTTPPRPEAFSDLVENSDVIITAIGN